jgi:hypothetical protein
MMPPLHQADAQIQRAQRQPAPDVDIAAGAKDKLGH